MSARWHPVGQTAAEILSESIEEFSPRIALSCSFGGPGGMVLLHLLSQLKMKAPVIFLDTQFLFPETLTLRDEIVERYGLEVLTYQPKLNPDQQAEAYGDALWARDPDQCCNMRKVAPMQQAIEDLQLDAWVTALRRDQSATRQDIGAIRYQTLPSGRIMAKVHPLANWTRSDVWKYIHQHQIPYNPLLDQGYQSLGCTHCTEVSSGTERSGRWSGHGKTECGLHTF